METVARLSPGRQSTVEDPRDRLRRQLAQEFAPIIAELAAKVDKASRHQSLADLRCPEATTVYLERALDFLIGPVQRTRMADVQAAQAHQHARKDKPAEDLAVAARQDVTKYGSRRTH